MKKIYKYPLLVSAMSIRITGLIEILSTMPQGNDIVIYALIDTEDFTETKVNYRVYGTGHEVEDHVIEEFRFLDTVNLQDGKYMFHVYVDDKNLI